MKQTHFQSFQPTLTQEGLHYFGLTLQQQKPSLALADTVYAFVQVTIDKPTPYPIVPDGSNILFFSQERGLFGGTHRAIIEAKLTIEKGEYFGIWFQPGAIRHYFNVDLAEVSDHITEMDFLENRCFLSLFERLYELPDFHERMNLCETLLLQHTVQKVLPDQFKQALSYVYSANGDIRIHSLANLIGWSDRHLNRQFLLHTGLGSKAFVQTVRLNHYLKRCYQDKLSPLFHGLDLGFFDQSHLHKSIVQQGLNFLTPRAHDFMSDFYKPQY